MAHILINRSAHDTGLASKSIHCITTSPPYFGLRSYQGEQDIEWPMVEYAPMAGLPMLTIAPMKCGLGAERTIEAYIGHLVLVMREMHRILRDDGVMFLNLGDSYFGGKGQNGNSKARLTADERGYTQSGGTVTMATRALDLPQLGLKPKDMCMIPARFALAAQADGWYLRSDIIWHKPNPMPESVTDRPTKSHEYVYLLTKSEKYFYDAEAVKETATNAGKIVTLGEKSFSRGQAAGAGIAASGNGTADSYTVQDGRNRRSVWTIATSPYPGSHFATWPQALVEPMIKAGSSSKGVCGAKIKKLKVREDLSVAEQEKVTSFLRSKGWA